MHVHRCDGHVGRLRRHRAHAMDVRQGIGQPGGSSSIQAGRRAQLATIQIDKAGRSTGRARMKVSRPQRHRLSSLTGVQADLSRGQGHGLFYHWRWNIDAAIPAQNPAARLFQERQDGLIMDSNARLRQDSQRTLVDPLNITFCEKRQKACS